MSDFQSPTPQQSIGFQFWKLHAKWQREISAALTPFDITHTQFVILATLRWFQEQSVYPSQVQISRLTGIEKMTLSKAIRRLQALELVRRIKSNHDTRSVSVSLTATGQAMIPRAIQKVEGIDEKVFGRIDAEKQLQLNGLIHEINQMQ